MAKVMVFDHPLIQHKGAMMRDKNTPSKEFRDLAREVAMLMAFEVTRDLPTQEVDIETPICPTKVRMLGGLDVAIVPILRAGLGFVDGMLEIIPNAKVGHVGLYRDPETHEPVEYYCKLPEDIDKRKVIIVDPMLATGGSAVDAINYEIDGTDYEIDGTNYEINGTNFIIDGINFIIDGTDFIISGINSFSGGIERLLLGAIMSFLPPGDTTYPCAVGEYVLLICILTNVQGETAYTREKRRQD